MKSRLSVLLALGGLGVAALYLTDGPPDGNSEVAAARVVQAPPMAPPAPASSTSPDAVQRSASDVVTAGSATGDAVAVTMYQGGLYLVTAKDADATKALRDAAQVDGGPAFQCTAADPAVKTGYTASELRARGG